MKFFLLCQYVRRTCDKRTRERRTKKDIGSALLTLRDVWGGGSDQVLIQFSVLAITPSRSLGRKLDIYLFRSVNGGRGKGGGSQFRHFFFVRPEKMSGEIEPQLSRLLPHFHILLRRRRREQKLSPGGGGRGKKVGWDIWAGG